MKNLLVLLSFLALSSSPNSEAVASAEHSSLYCWQTEGDKRYRINAGTKGLFLGRLEIHMQEKKILWWVNDDTYRELVIIGEGTFDTEDWIYFRPKAAHELEVFALNRKTGEGISTKISYEYGSIGSTPFEGMDWDAGKMLCETNSALF